MLNNDEIIILLHGFNKGPDDMMPLASGIKELGYESIVPRLPTLFGSLEDCVSSLEIQLFDVISDCRSFFIVAHSMGGLIAERYLLKNPSEKLRGKVYICSPFGGTRLAKIGFRLPIFGKLIKPIESLASGFPFYNADKKVNIGAISGSKCNLFLGKMLINEENDGRVEVSSSNIASAVDRLILNYGHKEIHHSNECITQVLYFIKNGKFCHHRAQSG